MEVFIRIVQLILSLSILVIAHEFGHYIAAKIFKARVEKFYLFFNPWFSIFKFKIGETEYGLGWLPLGGYVKIAGMIDESMDKEQMKKPPQPWEFRAKPAWQRLIIMLGGVIVNVLLAMIIYIFLLFTWGDQYLPTSEVNKYGIVVDSLGQELGLQTGDRILALDSAEVNNFSKIPATLLLDQVRTIQIEREGETKTLEIPEGFLSKLAKQKSPTFINFRIPYVAGKFTETSTAKQAGMEAGDRIIAFNNQPMFFFDEYIESIPKHKGEEVKLTLVRQKDTLDIMVDVPREGKIGVFPNDSLNAYFNLAEKHYTLLQAVPAGMARAYKGIGDYLKQLKLIFSPEVKAYESVGSFITIYSIFPTSWHWETFWRFTAFLSIMLAILNVLPIPALDGGHVMFVLYEMISGRKPSDKFMEYAQIVGMVILLAILVFALRNDIVNHLF
ncbi:MAG: RIP metalloprotease RseP [Bacteroidales bacterium]|nr:RIP metalloprotease RseP [Bacteroidales bacterium]MCF8351567.1 RIP metalloprotease RseP [Bacteroidales bacterium]MCF8376455.1 RIP metalloprotease RseP [Bacteroidales bacterium]MCF8400574.1 RIP metalloprotease RseP [Bacteroidales bacterium]